MTSPRELPPADRRLWLAACDGDGAARTELIERAWSVSRLRLRHFAADDRDEIRQRIAEAVLRALATGIVPQSNLDAMLEWRGRAEISAFVRRRVRDGVVTDVGEALELAGHDPSPYAGIEAYELHAMVQDCIARVPNADHRDAFRRRMLDGATPNEIARQREVTDSVVRVWIARAATLVRACLAKKLDHQEERP